MLLCQQIANGVKSGTKIIVWVCPLEIYYDIYITKNNFWRYGALEIDGDIFDTQYMSCYSM